MTDDAPSVTSNEVVRDMLIEIRASHKALRFSREIAIGREDPMPCQCKFCREPSTFDHDELAKSISGLCHQVIARRLEQFFEVIGEEIRKPESQVGKRDEVTK